MTPVLANPMPEPSALGQSGSITIRIANFMMAWKRMVKLSELPGPPRKLLLDRLKVSQNPGTEMKK